MTILRDECRNLKMDLNGSHRKWPTSGRRWASLERVLILCATMCVFSLMMLIKLDVTKSGGTVLWTGDYNVESAAHSNVIRQMAMPAMKTIVAYSPEKQAEMDRKYPILCDSPPRMPLKNHKGGSWTKVYDAGVSLYSAYYDDRTPQQPFIRILAVTNGTSADELPPLYCQTWRSQLYDLSPREDTEIIEATVIQIWWSEWDPDSLGSATPLLISCALDSSKNNPLTVAIVTSPCEKSSDSLPVKLQHNGPFVRNFTVCVKDMYFKNDISVRLIEWFELLKILGAEKVDVYVGSVPRLVSKILDYYVDSRIASVHPAPRKLASTLWQRRRDHLLAYNDCLYRNLRESRYVIPLDVDEVIVPRKVETWQELLIDLKNLENDTPGAASLAVSNAFFFDSFTAENTDKYSKNTKYSHNTKHNYISNDFTTDESVLKDESTENSNFKDVYRNRKDWNRFGASDQVFPHILRHVYRSEFISPAPQYSKSFVSTSRALTVFNHYALSALMGAERARAVPPAMALLHHYKATCRPALVDCHRYTSITVKDDSLKRFAERLIKNIHKVIGEI